MPLRIKKYKREKRRKIPLPVESDFEGQFPVQFSAISQIGSFVADLIPQMSGMTQEQLQKAENILDMAENLIEDPNPNKMAADTLVQVAKEELNVTVFPVVPDVSINVTNPEPTENVIAPVIENLDVKIDNPEVPKEPLPAIVDVPKPEPVIQPTITMSPPKNIHPPEVFDKSFYAKTIRIIRNNLSNILNKLITNDITPESAESEAIRLKAQAEEAAARLRPLDDLVEYNGLKEITNTTRNDVNKFLNSERTVEDIIDDINIYNDTVVNEFTSKFTGETPSEIVTGIVPPVQRQLFTNSTPISTSNGQRIPSIYDGVKGSREQIGNSNITAADVNIPTTDQDSTIYINQEGQSLDRQPRSAVEIMAQKAPASNKWMDLINYYAPAAATTAALLGVTYATSSDQNPAIKNFYLNRPQNVYEFAQQGERYDQLAEKMFQQEYKPLFPGRHFPTTMPEYKPQMQEMQQQIGNDLYQFKVI